MTDANAGSAHISIRPDFTGFHKSIQKQLAGTSSDFAKAGADAGKAFSDGFRKGAGDPFSSLRRPPDQTAAGARSGGQFADGFRKRVDAALKALPEAKIGASTTAAEQKIKDLRAELVELSGKTIGVDLSDAEALAKLKALQGELDEIGAKSPSVRVKVDVAAASAELAAFRGEVAAATSSSGGLQSALEGVAGQGFGPLGLAAATLGPALLPVLAAATADAIGLGVALGAAAAGTGALALAALPGISKIKAALTAQKTAATQAVAGQASSIAQIQSAESALTAAQQQATTAQKALSAARVQARKDAVDLANSVTDAALQEKSDALSILEARQALIEQDQQTAAAEQAVLTARKALATAQGAAAKTNADPNSTAAQKAAAAAAVKAAQANLTSAQNNARDQVLAQKRAQLAVAQAVQALKEQQLATKRLQQQQAESDKAGIAGDKNVVAARAQVAAADRQVADAERQLAQARTGTSGAAAKSAAATAALTGPEKALLAAFRALRGEYDRWGASLERPVFGVLIGGLRLAGRLLPDLTPLVTGSAKAFRGLETDASKALSGPFWKSFDKTIDRLAPKSITGLGKALGNVATGLAGLAKKAAPFTVGLLGSLDRVTKKFAGWATAKGPSAFTGFLDRAGKAAAPVGKLIVALAKAVPNLVRGLDPLAPVSLAIATALASLIANVPPKVITDFAAAFLLWKTAATGLGGLLKIVTIATKAWAIAQALLDLAFGPVTLIVIGVGLLVAALILAYKQSATFRKIVQAAFRGVLAAGEAVWKWIKSNWPLLLGILTGPFGEAAGLIIKYHTQIWHAAEIAWKYVTGFVSAAVSKIRGYAADIWDAISAAFGKILDGAAKAFGWVPGLGAKLKTADKQFQSFAASVDKSIRGIKGKTVGLKFALETSKIVGSLGGNTGVGILKNAAGGRIPGFGGGDIVPSLLEPGEAVVDKHRTRRYAGVLGAMGVPGFAAGGLVGSSALTVRDSLPKINPFIESLTSKIAAVVRTISGQIVPAGGSVGGSGVTRFAPFILQALRMLGQPAGDLGAVEHRMSQESGGNPTIVNKWDSNWAAGTPSVGLMQVIGPTYRSNAGPFLKTGPFEYGTSVNPLANIYAGLHHAITAYPGRSLASVMLQPGGYDSGGWLMPGTQAVVNATRKPEAVLTHSQWAAVSAAAMGGDGASGGDVYLTMGDPRGTTEVRVRAAMAAAAVAQRRTLRAGRRK